MRPAAPLSCGAACRRWQGARVCRVATGTPAWRRRLPAVRSFSLVAEHEGVQGRVGVASLAQLVALCVAGGAACPQWPFSDGSLAALMY